MVDLSYNKLSQLLLQNYTGIKKIDLSHNSITGSITLTYLTEAEYIDLSYNQLEDMLIDTFPANVSFDISHNRFTFATLPYLPQYAGYVYAPQATLEIVNPAPAVNISAQNRDIDGVSTSFIWKNVADGKPLAEGTDMECNGGATRFLPAALGKEVYCELSHTAFPQFRGEDMFCTTTTKIVDAPTKVVASFTTTSSVSNAEVIFRGHKNTALYIDWRGDGSEYTQYPVVSGSYLSYPEQTTYAGANVKIYTYEDPSDISVFSIYDTPMQNLDASALTGVYAFSIGGCGIDEANVVFPATTAIIEMNLSDNNFSTKNFSEFVELKSLNLSNNSYEVFDAGNLPALQTLFMDRNKLTELKLNNPSMWGLSVAVNMLSEMDFSNAKKITDLVLSNNNFRSIDLKPLASRLVTLALDQNRFTFASLPRRSAMYALTNYFYGNQADVEVTCVDGKVDLSDNAKVDGIATEYAWYLGPVEYDSETGEFVGELLDNSGADPEYTVENGVTSFFSTFDDNVCGVLTNSNYPNLILYTVPVHVDRSAGVDNVSADYADPDAPVDVYTVSGVLIRSQVAPAEATAGLAPGIYVVGGSKVAVR